MSFQVAEVCYALPNKQYLITVHLQENMTIRMLIVKSKILKFVPDLELEQLVIGVFSKKKQLDDMVQNGDRVEIYRPLTIDPMEARRIRAEKKRKEKNLKHFGA
ncbi:RnfH family protein [Thiotrichales bacterium 19S3-7]|nr:RnfH family protein [Thiotrichales bacterium 19S3-7]MCF6802666.1 RnfH family protein [Thiotrichales bacterium 19S3-11]